MSRVVSGRYSPPGADSVADAIRERRGARGITPLDASLLHVPHIAKGYNTLLGAIRTEGKLPGDIREAMILRIAALNHAAYEWIQHADLGRKEGLSSGQLYAIRDTKTPLPPSGIVLNSLQTVAVQFTDESSCLPRVSFDLIERFKAEIRNWVLNYDRSLPKDELETRVEDLYVEAAMVVATYNMVSRFLLSTDVAGMSDMEVPWPVDKKEHFITIPSFPPAKDPRHEIHAVTLTTSTSAPWIVFANSLLTDWTMWSYVVPVLLDLPSSIKDGDGTTYNILLHSQRGHGFSTLPPPAEGQERLTTIPLLATDIVNLLEAINISTPVHSVIGVSQGGAAALAFATLYGDKTRSIVVCDTAAQTPAGNNEAWEERIRLASGKLAGAASPADLEEYAQQIGMRKLAEVTVSRWFPEGSACHGSLSGNETANVRTFWVKEMISRTSLNGFIHGARALGSYDVLALPSPLDHGNIKTLFTTNVAKVLLLAGKLDGGGKVGNGLRALRETWKETIKRAEGQSYPSVGFVELDNSGHLPMVDSPQAFCGAVVSFLSS